MKKRIFGLDVMRALAIVFVMIAHTYDFLFPEIQLDLHRLFGFLGVEIFFVLSGFLIGGILIDILRKKDVFAWGDLKRFWIRRWFRTLPNYYLCFVLYMVFHTVSGIPSNLEAIEVPQYLLFLQNSFSPHPGFYAIAWSLSIEEWFYLLFPMVLFILLGRKPVQLKKVLWTILLFVLGCLAVRVLLSLQFDLSWGPWFRKMTFWRIDSIAIGVLFAYWQRTVGEKWIELRWPLALTGLVFSAILLIPFWQTYVLHGKSSLFQDSFFLTLFSLSAGCFLPLLQAWKEGKGLLAKWTTVISKISYSLYLIHWMVVLTFAKWIDISIPMVNFLGIWVVSLSLSWVIYTYFEIKMTALRDRF
jgi:peptidoglycan/LPS O-acetylase OafA/YrhL